MVTFLVGGMGLSNTEDGLSIGLVVAETRNCNARDRSEHWRLQRITCRMLADVCDAVAECGRDVGEPTHALQKTSVTI